MKSDKPSLAIAYAMQKRSPKKKFAQGGMAESPKYAEDMVNGKLKREGEIKAGSSRPSADDEDVREMMMDADGAHDMHAQDIDARDESMSGIDGEMRKRSQQMRMAQGGVMHKPEIDLRDEKMVTIDDDDKMRDMRMVDDKPMSHKSELSAKDEGHVGADSDDDMEMGMIRMALGGIADKIRSKKMMMAEGGEVDLQKSNGDEDLNNEDQMSFDAARKKTYFDDSQMSSQPEDSNMKGRDLPDEDMYDMVDRIRSKLRQKMSK